MADNQVVYDVEGDAILTDAIMNLVNTYPALKNEQIAFCALSPNSGKALFPTGGAVVERDRRDILGNRQQNCLYPFTVVYRVGGARSSKKITIKNWLDTFGCWLEMQDVQIDGQTYRLQEYPTLTGNRKITEITRQSPAYLESINDNGSENWVVSITIHYTNEIIKGA